MDNSIVDVLKHIHRRYGDDIFYNFTIVKNLLNDLAPNLVQERIQAKNFIDLNGFFILKYAGSSYPIIRRKLINSYAQTYCVDVGTATWIVDVFATVLGYIANPPQTDSMVKAINKYQQMQKGKLYTVNTPDPRPEPDAIPLKKTPLNLPLQRAPKNIIAADYHTVAVRADGTVVATGPNKYGQCDTIVWENIISVTAGFNYTAGLKANGTIVTTGSNDFGQCNVKHYREIVSIVAGIRHFAALTADGHVLSAGENKYGECEVSNWRNVIAIAVGYRSTFGIKKDGGVLTAGDRRRELNSAQLTDIVSISGSSIHGAIALKKDGTIVNVYRNMRGNFKKWYGITEIASTPDCFIGLRENGTVKVLAYYWESTGIECNTEDWTDIQAIAGGRYHVVGLKENGYVTAAMLHIDTKLDKGQCKVEDWNLST